MTNVIRLPIRKRRDHLGEALDAALALDTRPLLPSEITLRGELAEHLEKEFALDPEFARRTTEGM